MKDLTQGSLYRHILTIGTPIAIGLGTQSLYFLVDLYFVSRLGGAAIAGVGSAGIVAFIVMALTQVISVGTVVLVAQFTGAQDRAGASRAFNQAILLSLVCGCGVFSLGMLLTPWFMGRVAADAAAAAEGTAYLDWFMPGLALQSAFSMLGAALRGTGVTKPTMVAQFASVVINIVLAPVLIAGWGTGHALGSAGAGLASTIAVLVGVAFLWKECARPERYFEFNAALLRPQVPVLKRMLVIGLPAGGELACTFVIMSFIYAIIAPFGVAAQAGFGIGSRIMQAVFLPLSALSIAIVPVAGQNFGARKPARVVQSLYSTIIIETVIMLVVTLVCQIAPAGLVRLFVDDPAVVSVGAEFLRVVSWTFVMTGIVFACSGMFQALGNTWPALFSMASRMVSFLVVAMWLANRDDFSCQHIWYLSVGSVALQAFFSGWLVRKEMRARLASLMTPAVTAKPLENPHLDEAIDGQR